MKNKIAYEGLEITRFILVWSSLSPVFVLWAIRGVAAISDWYWIPVCVGLFLFPSLILWWILRQARNSENTKTILISSAKDQREHLLTYLFAMLIPLFDANTDEIRDLTAVSLALVFVMFLFWHMRLHYMNLFFALWGYRIFTVEAKIGTTETDRKRERFVTYAVISRRHFIPDDDTVTGYRLGGRVLFDKASDD
ncbi:hypothetical protein HFN78_35575 [Rhizobium laguerreae]|uniref:hypothetical protein n=1 Tax=Rhizobium laguerreae TaxID=1076926 RepID=UPI001C919484|nr:hypothetical protein [Rhizobium laguerreae]MBY3476151.1 hypothetical protein [Rhizobium laguerreae]MBY3524233.1 hypothetical protein [Rhizobium laguerreae]